MADGYGGDEGPLDAEEAGDQIKSISRRCRGRPRLTDSDRAQRRLESRKKYDVRRVYLGESHKVWSELRRRTSLSDAGLAEYLILLNSTYGERYQQKYGVKTTPEVCTKLKIGKNERVSSLCSMVTWYQDHSQTCPHEPQLRALEPQPGFSTSAIWQCDADHSFVQHLSSPPRGASEPEMETETEEEVDRDTRTEETGGIMTRRRRRETDAHRQLTDAGGDLEVAGAPVTMDQVEQATALSQLPGMEAPSRDTPLMEHLSENQSVWEMEVVMEAGRQQAQESDDEETGYNAVGEDINPEEEAEDLRRDRGDEGVGTSQDGYECVVVTASLTDRLNKADEEDTTQTMGDTVGVDTQTNLHPVPASMQVPGQGELFDSQTLQTVGTTCEIPDQRGTLDGSQLIIITGPSYEALASEGIQLNMGGGDVEEVTCTVIEGVAYNQMCQSVGDFRTTEEDSITDLFLSGLSDKELLQPSVESHGLEPTCERELQRGLSRCRRSRRGPVIEADGMLKMFHCPYEGCSQVYVAISSFQNHVNLVHRKGRTKVCPHPGCGKKFYLSNHLHRHMIIHSGVRDFICETCGKSFKRKNHLEVHRRTHTGETPLQCEICGYQCRQRASLNWHMKKHTPEAHYNFTCEHCGKRFEKLDSVKFHKLKSHPDKQAT
ncbi:zinc finger protein 653 isoform X1 [Salvelinus sp. IW2-2015]|uniref:zinc finger protein 653 isoform X1 n=1 Tax=Salvelinus sp. IW2-2015 TaxID=2691554 RepID=UPI000CDF88B8|nr:zinc finger protein 653 isoform X1 [Salvelinus alpinus]